MNISVKVRISGRVQGVSYRYATKRQADILGVSGWVRNLPGGDVEGCFEGDEASVTALVDWCRTGPPAARVDRVVTTPLEPAGHSHGFAISG